MQIVVGEHDLLADDENELLVNVNKFILHPKYKSSLDGDSYEEFDFAILEVDDMKLDGKTRTPVCLPKQGEHVEASNGEWVLGRMGQHRIRLLR